MIGKIQERNVSVPVEGTPSTIGDGFIEDPDYRTPRLSFGVGSVEDSFEKTQEDSIFEKLGLGTKSVVEPIGYPGEEWLWENSEVKL